MAEIAGFWSYVHADNDSVGGAIAKLAERVMSEFELLSGEPLRLFVDRTDIEWGDEWRARIDRELQETTFFIPIITPRYFQSEECRRELVKFKSAADRFNVKQLLLPIYYVPVPEIKEQEPEDELIALIKASQRVDMRKVRLADEADATYRQLVNALSSRLLKISRETEGLSAPSGEQIPAVVDVPEPVEDLPDPSGDANPPAVEPEGDDPSAEEGEDEVGSLEILASGEEALSSWVTTVQELNVEIKQVGALVEESSPEVAAAQSFAEQLAATNRLAVKLDEPAESLTRIAQDYSMNLIKIDPAVQALIERAQADEETKEEAENKEFFAAMLAMVAASRESGGGIEELIGTMEGPAAQSRELRQRLRRIQTALRNIVDGQKVLYDWDAQLRDLYGDELDDFEEMDDLDD